MNLRGYASIFDVPDSGGDVVRPGAFLRSLAAGYPLALLWDHDTRRPIGAVNAIYEDATGLLVAATMERRGALGEFVTAQLLSGALSGLSFGYRVRAARQDRERGIRELVDVDLLEVSLVARPMQQHARLLW